MKLQLIASAVLATTALFAAQASFAEESSVMQARMAQLGHVQQQVEQTASQHQDAVKSGQQG